MAKTKPLAALTPVERWDAARATDRKGQIVPNLLADFRSADFMAGFLHAKRCALNAHRGWEAIHAEQLRMEKEGIPNVEADNDED